MVACSAAKLKRLKLKIKLKKLLMACGHVLWPVLHFRDACDACLQLPACFMVLATQAHTALSAVPEAVPPPQQTLSLQYIYCIYTLLQTTGTC